MNDTDTAHALHIASLRIMGAMDLLVTIKGTEQYLKTLSSVVVKLEKQIDLIERSMRQDNN